VLVALACMLAGATAASAALTARPLGLRLGRTLAGVAPGASGALALDLATGDVVYSRSAALPLAPASTEKLLVTYAALQRLGPSFEIVTIVLGEGRQVGREWRGDLVLQGHGDPTLSSAGLRALARQLSALGIARVTGAIVGDEGYFDTRRTAPGWKASFAMDESPPLSALAVDGDVYHGRLGREPALAAAARFHELLLRAGIRVAKPPRVREATLGAIPLASIASPPLAEVLRGMDVESDNFAAELLLKLLGAVTRGSGTTAAGALVVRETLAQGGLPLDGVRVVDGSGLSLLDRITARTLVGVLRALWEEPALRPVLLAALPVAGRSGTLRHRLRLPAVRGAVRAKTGTTEESSALAGFVRGRFVFAIVQNGSPVPRKAARAAQDRFVALLAFET
jgi:D-alanyl-D-alanine carboxypeptidase/D-alanyl-D-alanine-endopeptidase (penicillin-binding protein 4)